MAYSCRKFQIDFQTNALSSPSDWSDFRMPPFYWPSAPSTEHYLENLALV